MQALRAEVRAFLTEAMAGVPVAKRVRNWAGSNPEFTRKMAARGWIGMTWPKRYGGGERVVARALRGARRNARAAGAPVGAHWVADRQSGPLLMRFRPTCWRRAIVPRIVRGEAFFCIGMSEPDSGSDLASIRTKAVRTAQGWLINGRKVWTSRAHHAHCMIVLVRTGERGENRHAGLSQLLLEMNTPGITVRPIINQLKRARLQRSDRSTTCWCRTTT